MAATYCPLCNAAIVFDRRHDGDVLDFGTTGNLRHSDLVIYDRQTETWWQQYTGEAIIGRRAGEKLMVLACRFEDWQSFKTRHPDGTVMTMANPQFRPYGANPYSGYDSSGFPFLYNGDVPEGIAPLVSDGITITWKPGQNSALDQRDITRGRDAGTVTVTQKKRHLRRTRRCRL